MGASTNRGPGHRPRYTTILKNPVYKFCMDFIKVIGGRPGTDIPTGCELFLIAPGSLMLQPRPLHKYHGSLCHLASQLEVRQGRITVRVGPCMAGVLKRKG